MMGRTAERLAFREPTAPRRMSNSIAAYHIVPACQRASNSKQKDVDCSIRTCPERKSSCACRQLPSRTCRPLRCRPRSEEHTSELQSRFELVCRLLLEKKKKTTKRSSIK